MTQTQSAVQQWDAIYNAPTTGDPEVWLAICDGVQAAEEAEQDAAEENVALSEEAWAKTALTAYREWLAKPTTAAPSVAPAAGRCETCDTGCTCRGDAGCGHRGCWGRGARPSCPGAVPRQERDSERIRIT